MALTDKLSAIGNAIREKGGTTELLTLDEMPTAIGAIETGGGGGGVDIEPIILSGECDYACAGVLASDFIKNYSDKISTNDITNANRMFYYSTLECIPFALNFNQTKKVNLSCLFEECKQLKEVTNIIGVYPNNIESLFRNCKMLRSLPENFGESWNWNELHTYSYSRLSSIFRDCFSLRKIPSFFMSNLWGTQTSSSYAFYSYAFYNCYSLDEIDNLPIQQATLTSNVFYSTFSGCTRINSFTFAINEDGTAKTANWKSQTIDLTSYSGWSSSSYEQYITSYNSGITVNKRVSNDTDYAKLKNDADWYTREEAYSRYNHDSAVNTINSLPDTSAYGTNTIKFKGAAGSKTDGGAINTLTEEEIAVAAAKGWTVTLA